MVAATKKKKLKWKKFGDCYSANYPGAKAHFTINKFPNTGYFTAVLYIERGMRIFEIQRDFPISELKEKCQEFYETFNIIQPPVPTSKNKAEKLLF